MKTYCVSYMCVFTDYVEANSAKEAAEIAANHCPYDVDGDPCITVDGELIEEDEEE